MIFMCLQMTTHMNFIYMKLWKGLEKLVLNYDKGIVKLKCCSFFGIIYTPGSAKPDPSKVDQHEGTPSTKYELQSFLGIDKCQ